MGVSLAKEPYVQDARPSHDRRAMIAAALMHLQAATSASALSSSAAHVAPRLLALCGLSRDDIESVAPIQWNADPADRQAALDRALHVLISTLYSPTACSALDLRRLVLDVVRPLRGELLAAHRRVWYDDRTALAFADRLWEERPQGLAARAARTAWSMSSALPRASAAKRWPSAGSTTESVWPEAGAVQRLAMKW